MKFETAPYIIKSSDYAALFLVVRNDLIHEVHSEYRATLLFR